MIKVRVKIYLFLLVMITLINNFVIPFLFNNITLQLITVELLLVGLPAMLFLWRKKD